MTSATDLVHSAWRCPNCRGSLSGAEDTFTCDACGDRFPRLGTVPVLVPDPAAYIASNAVSLARYVGGLQMLLARGEALEQAQPFRKTALEQARRALSADLELATGQLFGLAAHADVASLIRLAADPPPQAAGLPFNESWGPAMTGFLRADWGGTPDGEKQIATIRDELARAVQTHARRRGTAVLLGAGTGRFVHELSGHFDSVFGVDLCLAYVDWFHRLLQGPLNLWELHYPQLGGDNVATPIEAKLTQEAAARMDARSLAVADALKLPVADGTLSAAIAVHFMDCVPARPLLEELRRVLEPGGIFVGYGPLLYRGVEDPADWLTPSEWKHLFAEAGLEMLEERWLDLPYWQGMERAIQTTHRVWTFTLRKPS
ncbi:methyltransferase domain-containing protein [Corallococcus exercitus]|uniref:methyltransferase domain-containing protein n=1 Tax=Corallococcus exercitus TaxID=2316736 RepID=UPI000EA2665B|nr:methyltransferase domain-containing protein [Corallococcus exercitus]RKG67198.1 methyltransferase domain-containing protein [Corallococcus exercitus]